MLKRTALYETHKNCGARLVEFGGWEMPVQYEGIQIEHAEVRQNSGIFDISHMGQIYFKGKNATEFVNQAFTNDASKLSDGFGQYTILCHSDGDGGTVDDLYLFRINQEKYLAIVNASRINEDLEFLLALAEEYSGKADLSIANESENCSAVAIQGPHSLKAMGNLLQDSQSEFFSDLKKNQIVTFFSEPLQAEYIISRTGYTGEDGFEVLGDHGSILKLWHFLLSESCSYSPKPIGLGARDSLRLEAGYSLYGHELTPEILPVEAGLMWAVASEKKHFSGKSSIEKLIEKKDRNKLVGFVMVDKAPPPRQGYAVFDTIDSSNPVGILTSGGLNPMSKKGIALGYIPAPLSRKDRDWWIEIRGKKYRAQQHNRSFLSLTR